MQLTNPGVSVAHHVERVADRRLAQAAFCEVLRSHVDCTALS
jgi:hypothetical protein